MGIFFTHTEDSTYHIYRQKRRRLFVTCGTLGLISIFMYFFLNREPLNSFLEIIAGAFLIFWVIILLDFMPINFRKNGARALGNEVIEKGNLVSGEYYEIKIGKKGLRL